MDKTFQEELREPSCPKPCIGCECEKVAHLIADHFGLAEKEVEKFVNNLPKGTK